MTITGHTETINLKHRR